MRLLIALLIATLSLTTHADEAHLRELVRRLDDDDPARRESALGELSKAGPEALPLLDDTARTGAPEVRERAALAARRIRAAEVLNRREAAELKARWEAVEHGDPRTRRAAIKEWVAACGRKPETVDALLELLRADPSGVAGGAACEALNRLCAPRQTARVEDAGLGVAWTSPMPAVDFLRWVFDKGLEISDGARDRLAEVVLSPESEVRVGSNLDKLRWIGELAAVTWRMNDDRGSVRIELPEESLAAWEPWWAEVKADPKALADLGLAAPAGPEAFQGKGLDEWAAALAARDPRHARAARTVLREAPDDVAAELQRRAGAKDAPQALRDFARRLALRHRGRVYFTLDDADWVMNLDGSGAREVSGGLPIFYSGEPSPDGRIAWIPISKGRERGLYVLDLVGSASPRRISRRHGACFHSPDATRIAIRDDAGGLWLVDAATGNDESLMEKDNCYVVWSPDGRYLAVQRSGADGIQLRDLRTGEVREIPDSVAYLQLPYWRPDSRAWASRRPVDDPGNGRRRGARVELTDAGTGKTRVIVPEIRDLSVSPPVWSDDGARLAVGWLERPGTAKILVFDGATSTTQTFSHPVTANRQVAGDAFVFWDGAGRVAWQHWGVAEGWGCEIATGAWAKARKPTYSEQLVAGGEWRLDSDDAGDILLTHVADGTVFNITESAGQERNVRAMPPLK